MLTLRQISLSKFLSRARQQVCLPASQVPSHACKHDKFVTNRDPLHLLDKSIQSNYNVIEFTGPKKPSCMMYIYQETREDSVSVHKCHRHPLLLCDTIAWHTSALAVEQPQVVAFFSCPLSFCTWFNIKAQRAEHKRQRVFSRSTCQKTEDEIFCSQKAQQYDQRRQVSMVHNTSLFTLTSLMPPWNDHSKEEDLNGMT